MFLKVMTACKNVSAATSCCLCASHEVIPQKGNDSLIIGEGRGGRACAVGKAASAVRKAALRHSCTGQCNRTCCTDSMLFGCSQAGHMRSCLSWLGWSLNLLSCCRNMEVPERSWKPYQSCLACMAACAALQVCPKTRALIDTMV